MTEDLDRLPLADADRLAREHIEAAREEMSHWRLLRGRRLLTERQAGKTVEEIATEIGLTTPTVYEIMRAAKRSS
jgi:AraC-like DNA-binding protein